MWRVCGNLFIQYCEAAGLLLSVQQHTRRRRDYTRFEFRFGHLAGIVQNGATMGGSRALNPACLLLPAVTFLMTKCNTFKCTLLRRHLSVNILFVRFDFLKRILLHVTKRVILGSDA